jgi:arylsulfatase A-like enzyme
LRGGRRSFLPIGAVAAFCMIGAALAQAAPAEPAASSKPNILIIWGDDIGGFNINAYNQGVMGYRTPNIDRIAKEGAMFTDWYGQQSCTAGRAAFITGQSPIRTGLTSRPSRRTGRHQGGRPDHPHAAQAAGLRNGSVWQEPFG